MSAEPSIQQFAETQQSLYCAVEWPLDWSPLPEAFRLPPAGQLTVPLLDWAVCASRRMPAGTSACTIFSNCTPTSAAVVSSTVPVGDSMALVMLDRLPPREPPSSSLPHPPKATA